MEKVNKELESLQLELQKLGPAIDLLKRTGQFSEDLIKGSENVAAQGQILTDSVSCLVTRFSTLTEKSEQVAQKLESLEFDHHFGTLSENQKQIFETVGKIDQNHDDHKNHFAERLDKHSVDLLENIQAQEANILSKMEGISQSLNIIHSDINALNRVSKANRMMIIAIFIFLAPVLVASVCYILNLYGISINPEL